MRLQEWCRAAWALRLHRVRRLAPASLPLARRPRLNAQRQAGQKGWSPHDRQQGDTRACSTSTHRTSTTIAWTSTIWTSSTPPGRSSVTWRASSSIATPDAPTTSSSIPEAGSPAAASSCRSGTCGSIRDNEALRADMGRSVIERFPEFDEDRFEQMSEDEARLFNERTLNACCASELQGRTGVDRYDYDKWSHYAQPDWWRSTWFTAGAPGMTTRDTDRDGHDAQGPGTLHSPAIAARSPRERVIARERRPDARPTSTAIATARTSSSTRSSGRSPATCSESNTPGRQQAGRHRARRAGTAGGCKGRRCEPPAG